MPRTRLSQRDSKIVRQRRLCVRNKRQEALVHELFGCRAAKEARLEPTGGSELVQFIRLDPGAVLRKESPQAGCSHRHRQSASDEGNGEVRSYAPVSILVDERFDGVHLSYDTMASLLAPY